MLRSPHRTAGATASILLDQMQDASASRLGLKGTGSDTYALNDLFVTEDRAITALARNPAERRVRGFRYTQGSRRRQSAGW
jgi:hypothetical protein